VDRVEEITIPEWVLRIELNSTEMDGSGRITAYLNGEQITKEQAEELIKLARRLKEIRYDVRN
jgi:HEPN domain-containing protein